ncbi:hypothetical protein PCASD_17959 [Puccinia coronata f. sp. avenae]|uniref:Uncharacterized protein n=1 Tax=Puccinia coronata f. sp. avenae TaxID=200324 RepID=A0A2N5U458_9BASI|nr:hypothetical protein PCASD_17959 [Puccinia coronata f. sp. avenae]
MRCGMHDPPLTKAGNFETSLADGVRVMVEPNTDVPEEVAGQVRTGSTSGASDLGPDCEFHVQKGKRKLLHTSSAAPAAPAKRKPPSMDVELEKPIDDTGAFNRAWVCYANTNACFQGWKDFMVTLLHTQPMNKLEKEHYEACLELNFQRLISKVQELFRPMMSHKKSHKFSKLEFDQLVQKLLLLVANAKILPLQETMNIEYEASLRYKWIVKYRKSWETDLAKSSI